MDQHHDPTDRGQAPTGSALTLSSSQPLPDWWTVLTAEMDRLMKLLPPEGHTAEMIGARSKAAGKYLAERYRNRPEVTQALRQVIDRGLSQWTKFPPPSELVERIDSWLGFESREAESEARQARMKATRLRLEAERLREAERVRRRLQTDPEFRALVERARTVGIMPALRQMSPAP